MFQGCQQKREKIIQCFKEYREFTNFLILIIIFKIFFQKQQLSAMLDEDPSLMEKRDQIVKRLELYKSARNEIDSVAWK